MPELGDTGEDPEIKLEPIKRGPGRPRNPEPTPPPADVATTLAQAFAQALGQATGPKAAPVRMPEDHTEVRVIANRAFHVSPADLAFSQIDGTAYGQDGDSRQYKEGDLIVMRPCAGLDWLLDKGFVRPERRA